MDSKIILGIDPGLNITGFGLIKVFEKSDPQLIDYGHIRTNSKNSLSERIHYIFTNLNLLISKVNADIIAIEDLFYAANVKTAIVLGHARGAAIVAAMENNLKVYDYSPREVKMSVVGNGAAVKSQVQFMVRSILKLKENISPLDASDALAVALCHWNRMKMENLTNV
jgi:crossover junction endodeoxyribonuclease RuvC